MGDSRFGESRFGGENPGLVRKSRLGEGLLRDSGLLAVGWKSLSGKNCISSESFHLMRPSGLVRESRLGEKIPVWCDSGLVRKFRFGVIPAWCDPGLVRRFRCGERIPVW